MKTLKQAGVCAALVVAVGVLNVACTCGISDPGWRYKSARGRPVQGDGLWYELPAVAGVGMRVNSELFAGTLSVDLELRNGTQDMVEVNLHSLTVSDAKGTKLRRRVDFPTTQCGGQRQGDMCVLSTGQSCRLAGGFNARPFETGLGAILQRRNADLARITVEVLPKPKAGGGDAELRIPLIWD
jgi:hypothetical protein